MEQTAGTQLIILGDVTIPLKILKAMFKLILGNDWILVKFDTHKYSKDDQNDSDRQPEGCFIEGCSTLSIYEGSASTHMRIYEAGMTDFRTWNNFKTGLFYGLEPVIAQNIGKDQPVSLKFSTVGVEGLEYAIDKCSADGVEVEFNDPSGIPVLCNMRVPHVQDSSVDITTKKTGCYLTCTANTKDLHALLSALEKSVKPVSVQGIQQPIQFVISVATPEVVLDANGKSPIPADEMVKGMTISLDYMNAAIVRVLYNHQQKQKSILSDVMCTYGGSFAVAFQGPVLISVLDSMAKSTLFKEVYLRIDFDEGEDLTPNSLTVRGIYRTPEGFMASEFICVIALMVIENSPTARTDPEAIWKDLLMSLKPASSSHRTKILDYFAFTPGEPELDTETEPEAQPASDKKTTSSRTTKRPKTPRQATLPRVTKKADETTPQLTNNLTKRIRETENQPPAKQPRTSRAKPGPSSLSKLLAFCSKPPPAAIPKTPAVVWADGSDEEVGEDDDSGSRTKLRNHNMRDDEEEEEEF